MAPTALEHGTLMVVFVITNIVALWDRKDSQLEQSWLFIGAKSTSQQSHRHDNSFQRCENGVAVGWERTKHLTRTYFYAPTLVFPMLAHDKLVAVYM